MSTADLPAISVDEPVSRQEQVFTAEGKKALQKRLVTSINQVLQEKEGFGGISNVYFTNFIVQ